MEFEWDDGKRRINLQKHGSDFADVWELFDGWWLEQKDTRYDYGESRWNALGLIGERVYVCTFTRRNGAIRIIAARKGNIREQRTFKKALACHIGDCH